MRVGKRSFYQARIESLKSQNETESQAIKELLSPASYEKLKKAESALSPQSRQYKLWATESKPNRPEGRKLSTNFKSKPRRTRLIKIAKKPSAVQEHIKALVGNSQNSARHNEVDVNPDESIETIGPECEFQESIAKFEKEAKKSLLSSTMQHMSWSFKVESNEFELVDGCSAEEQDSLELWEPKVELLEAEDPQIPLQPDSIKLEYETETEKELPVSYVTVDQLPRLGDLENESKSVEVSGQPQIIRLSAVPAGGVGELVKVENNPEAPLTFIPASQLSNFYFLS